MNNDCSMCGEAKAELIDGVCRQCNPDSHAYIEGEMCVYCYELIDKEREGVCIKCAKTIKEARPIETIEQELWNS